MGSDYRITILQNIAKNASYFFVFSLIMQKGIDFCFLLPEVMGKNLPEACKNPFTSFLNNKDTLNTSKAF